MNFEILTHNKPQPRKVLLYGSEGTGKSTWAARSPNCLILDIEGGLNDLRVAGCQRSPRLTNYQDVIGYLRWLTGPEQASRFATLAIDSLGFLQRLIWEHVCKANGKKNLEDFGFGAGYKLAMSEWNSILAGLTYLNEQLGKHVVLISHANAETVYPPGDDSYTRYTPNIHAAANDMFRQWATEVLFISYSVTVSKEKSDRRAKASGGREVEIHTQNCARFLAKNRLGLAPILDRNPASFWDVAANQFAASQTSLADEEQAEPELTSVQ